jgi:hypothetical protein
MGISNTIPPSRLIQPGVVANTAARPTSPFTGQAIYQVDTNQMLIWNGTAWVIPNTPAQNPTGLELITTTTCSAGGTASNGVITIGTTASTVSVGSAFSSTYDNYEIVMAGGTASVALPSLQFQFAGITSGSYYGAWVAARYTTGATTGLGVNGTTSWTYAGQHLNGNHVMSLKVWGANKATRKYCSNGFFVAAANGDFGVSTGECIGTTAETGFNIIPSSGTLTGGTIRVYGYRN